MVGQENLHVATHLTSSGLSGPVSFSELAGQLSNGEVVGT
jgi:hypothetical protein